MIFKFLPDNKRHKQDKKIVIIIIINAMHAFCRNLKKIKLLLTFKRCFILKAFQKCLFKNLISHKAATIDYKGRVPVIQNF